MISYLWLKTYTTDQYLKLLNTYSDHRNLEKTRKTELFSNIQAFTEERYGVKVKRPYLSVLYITKKKKT